MPEVDLKTKWKSPLALLLEQLDKSGMMSLEGLKEDVQRRGGTPMSWLLNEALREKGPEDMIPLGGPAITREVALSRFSERTRPRLVEVLGKLSDDFLRYIDDIRIKDPSHFREVSRRNDWPDEKAGLYWSGKKATTPDATPVSPSRRIGSPQTIDLQAESILGDKEIVGVLRHEFGHGIHEYTRPNTYEKTSSIAKEKLADTLSDLLRESEGIPAWNFPTQERNPLWNKYGKKMYEQMLLEGRRKPKLP